MERLTQRCNCGICGSNGNVLLYPLYRIGGDEYMDHGLINQCFEKLAKYEDLEEQGLLLRLQRKVVGYYVIFKKCGCRTPYYQYQYAPIEVKKQEAIEAWNRRT